MSKYFLSCASSVKYKYVQIVRMTFGVAVGRDEKVQRGRRWVAKQGFGHVKEIVSSVSYRIKVLS